MCTLSLLVVLVAETKLLAKATIGETEEQDARGPPEAIAPRPPYRPSLPDRNYQACLQQIRV
jgi:hypothetical protein